MATSIAFGGVRIQLTDPFDTASSCWFWDFAALFDLFYICFHIAEAEQSDRIKILAVLTCSMMFSRTRIGIFCKCLVYMLFPPRIREIIKLLALPPHPVNCDERSDLVRIMQQIKELFVLYNMLILQTCRCCFYHIRNLRRIRRYMYFAVAKTIATALVCSILDYCNSLYHNIVLKDILKIVWQG